MTIVSPGGKASDLLFRVGDQVILGAEGVYLGTYVAPNDRIRLASNSSLRGALYGARVRVHTSCKVEGEPALALYLSAP